MSSFVTSMFSPGPLVYKQADKRAKPKQIGHAYKSVCGLRAMAYRYSFYLSGGSLEI